MWIFGSAIVTAVIMLAIRRRFRRSAGRRTGEMRVQVGGVSERWLAQHRASRDDHSV
jgi:beta-lactamase regulating signal transducer with metallopeptidase domain